MPLQSVSLIIKSMLKDCLGPMENTIVSREFRKAYGLLTPDLLTAVHGPGSQLYSVRTESRRKGQQGSCWCHTLVVKPKNDEDNSLAPLPCSAQKSTPRTFVEQVPFAVTGMINILLCWELVYMLHNSLHHKSPQTGVSMS